MELAVSNSITFFCRSLQHLLGGLARKEEEEEEMDPEWKERKKEKYKRFWMTDF